MHIKSSHNSITMKTTGSIEQGGFFSANRVDIFTKLGTG